MKTRRRPQTPAEEIFNSIAHGLGFIAILLAYPTLLAAAVRHGRPYVPAAVTAFTATFALLFLLSTVHHALPRNRAKRLFQKLDQSAIFLGIAGAYTPFAIGALAGVWSWAVFASIWGLAVLGIVIRACQGFRGTHLTAVMYVTLSVLALIAAVPGLARLPVRGLWWVAAGLLAYLVGILFFLAHHLRFRHLLWHLCVLVGSACHFLTVFWYVC